MHSDPTAIEIYAKFTKISKERARQTRDQFSPMDALNPDAIVALMSGCIN
jgi:hypothetical protein